VSANIDTSEENNESHGGIIKKEAKLIGYFEGIDSERGIAWRAADSFALRRTGAIVGVTVQGADEGDTTTIERTLPEAAEQLEAVAAVIDDAVTVIEEIVADKGYHSRTTLRDLERLEIRTYISEPERGPQSWIGQEAERDAVYANRRWIRGDRGKRSFGNEANCPNGRVRISMRPVACGARPCAYTRRC
jgi:hypothetical protein